MLKAPRLKPLALTVAALLVSPAVHAIEFSGSGFLTVAAGKVLKGSNSGVIDTDGDGIPDTGRKCKCQISEFSQGAVYENDSGRAFQPDSKLGLQGKVSFTNDLSLTGQVVLRGVHDGLPGDGDNYGVEWLYGSYKITNSTTLQVGRKRLPLFYYSEQQDVGYTYPWVHLPPQTYGWEAVNYNGANLTHLGQIGDWSTTLNVFGGGETRKNNRYQTIYYGTDAEIDTKWSDIIGTELLFQKDWFEGRLMYMQSKTQGREIRYQDGSEAVSPDSDWSAEAKQKIFGASVILDPGAWVIRGEVLVTDRKETYGSDFAGSASLGYRFGKLLPLLTYAKYKQKIDENNPDGAVAATDLEVHDVTSFVLRYELTGSSAVKVQYDDWKSKGSGTWFQDNYGDSQLISASYDMIF